MPSLAYLRKRKKKMLKRKGYMRELVEYIKKNLKKGYTKESLKWALINQGYSRLEVEKAIKNTDETLAHQAPILKTRPQIKYEIIEPKGHALKPKKYSFFKYLWQKTFG